MLHCVRQHMMPRFMLRSAALVWSTLSAPAWWLAGAAVALMAAVAVALVAGDWAVSVIPTLWRRRSPRWPTLPSGSPPVVDRPATWPFLLRQPASAGRRDAHLGNDEAGDQRDPAPRGVIQHQQVVLVDRIKVGLRQATTASMTLTVPSSIIMIPPKISHPTHVGEGRLWFMASSSACSCGRAGPWLARCRSR
jgi:hypothetical protein